MIQKSTSLKYDPSISACPSLDHPRSAIQVTLNGRSNIDTDPCIDGDYESHGYPLSGVGVKFDSNEVLGSPAALWKQRMGLQGYLAHKKQRPPRTLQ